jgi:hypothetical protein
VLAEDAHCFSLILERMHFSASTGLTAPTKELAAELSDSRRWLVQAFAPSDHQQRDRQASLAYASCLASMSAMGFKL